jgi:hypothetical protein
MRRDVEVVRGTVWCRRRDWRDETALRVMVGRRKVAMVAMVAVLCYVMEWWCQWEEVRIKRRSEGGVKAERRLSYGFTGGRAVHLNRDLHVPLSRLKYRSRDIHSLRQIGIFLTCNVQQRWE